MYKHMKSATIVGLFMLASMAATAASTAAPVGNTDFPDLFWSELRMKTMDRNNDGMVSRDEFLTYMSTQFDQMDQNRDRMLTAKEFMDKKMMAATFPSSAMEHGPAR